MENPVTNLSEINANFVKLFNAETGHTDIRELFVPQSAVTEALEIQMPIGPDEYENQLVYENPNNDQVPALKSLLNYIEQVAPGGTVNKYYTIRRKHFSVQDGDVHLKKTQRVHMYRRTDNIRTDEHFVHMKRHTHEHAHRHVLEQNTFVSNHRKNVRNQRIHIDMFAPTIYTKQIKHVKNIRPIVIFSEHI